MYTWRARLNEKNSVFQAEALAVYHALSWHFRTQGNEASFLVHTDSLSTIHALLRPKLTSKLMQDIVLLFHQHHGTYAHITWVKAHVGVLGNEIADYLAKQATDCNSDLVEWLDHPLPRSSVKRALRESTANKWQQHWTTSSKGRLTHKFLPTTSCSFLSASPLINMFITGRGPFPSFLHHIGKLDVPLCICGQEGDPLHYIWDCPLTSVHHLPRPAAHLEDTFFSTFLSYQSNIKKTVSLMSWLVANGTFILPP